MALILAVTSAVMFVLGLCFGSLTVQDEGDFLAVRYGPLPLFVKRIAYSSITAVSPGRSTLLDGWGIHHFPAAAGSSTSGAATA
ncbi:MAG: hypothetical protein HYS13_11565 [Planctomycetia bacterium]|nr:hypothetical protein [Planctomycetia bacterium]